MSMFRTYVYVSVIIFICLVVIFLVSPESFIIG